MRYTQLFVLLFALQLNAAPVFSQQPAGKAVDNSFRDNSIVAGNFAIDKPNKDRGITEHINVNYVMSPAPFKNILKLELGTPNPLLFSADITDVNGKVVKHWVPVQRSYYYKDVIDISQLAPGDYYLNLYCEYSTALMQRVSFKKEM